MSKITTTLFMVLFCTGLSFGQNLVNAFTKNGKVFAQFDNGSSRQLSGEGTYELEMFSRSKNLVLYKKLIKKSKTADMEGEETSDQYSYHLFNLNSNIETHLFTSCHDGKGGTKPDYAGSSIFPFDVLCNVDQVMMNKEGTRIYFQTDAWTTSGAIHYYNISEKRLVFYMAGSLQEVNEKGVVVHVSGIDMVKKNGELVSNGRYFQTCLFDFNGDLIRELSPKEF